MTTVTVYRSTDTSAPTLSGTAGALLTVLDAVLVNGYGSQTAAGWTKPFVNAGNIGCYRNSAVDGTGFHLHIDDSGTNNTAKESLACGFETLSALSTGTGQFPTAAQLNLFVSTPTGGVVIRKSTTADATARAWTIVADDTCFYLFTETGDSNSPTLPYAFAFGDIFSYKSSDAYRCIIVGRNVANSADARFDPLSVLLNTTSATFMTSTIAGHYMARSWTATGGSILVAKHTDQTKFGSGTGSGGTGTSGTTNPSNTNVGISVGFNGLSSPSNFPYPNGPDGGLYLAPIWIHHSNSVRGYFKGIWCPLHDRPLNHNDTYSGTGTMAGKTFLVQTIIANGNGAPNPVAGQIHIETSSTWS